MTLLSGVSKQKHDNHNVWQKYNQSHFVSASGLEYASLLLAFLLQLGKSIPGSQVEICRLSTPSVNLEMMRHDKTSFDTLSGC